MIHVPDKRLSYIWRPVSIRKVRFFETSLDLDCPFSIVQGDSYPKILPDNEEFGDREAGR
jgi:hypothetical protein